MIPGTGRFARVALPGSQSDLAKIVSTTGEGTVVDIPLGILGAIIGGWLYDLFGGSGVTGFNIEGVYSAGIAAIGAIIVLVPYHAFFRRSMLRIRISFTTANHICWSARATEIGNSSAITVYGPCLHLQTGCVQQGNVAGHAVAVLCNRSPTPSRLMPTEFIRVKNVPCNQPRTSAILSKF